VARRLAVDGENTTQRVLTVSCFSERSAFTIARHIAAARFAQAKNK
jgi:hypothetical protein